MKYLSKIFFSVAVFFLVKLPALAITFPGGGGGSGLPAGRPITLGVLDQVIFNISIFFIRTSAVLAVIFIVWSGVTYMYAGDDPTKVTAAQNRLKSGVIGAAVVFGVGVIIQTIAGVVTGEFFCTGLWIPGVGICL